MYMQLLISFLITVGQQSKGVESNRKQETNKTCMYDYNRV